MQKCYIDNALASNIKKMILNKDPTLLLPKIILITLIIICCIILVHTYLLEIILLFSNDSEWFFTIIHSIFCWTRNLRVAAWFPVSATLSIHDPRSAFPVPLF